MNRYSQWIKLDKFRRHQFLKSELKKKILKSIIKNTKISNFIKGSTIIVLGIGIPVIYHTHKEKK